MQPQPMRPMQRIDYWDVARLSKLPGAEITTKVDSSQWTVRTKNAVKRMLMRGQIVGGYSSVTAKLAGAVAREFAVRCCKFDACQIIVNSPSIEMCERLIPLVQADYTTYRLERGSDRQDWVINRMTRATKELQGGSLAEFSYYFHCNAFAEQARDVLAELNTADNIERAREACDAIDAGETFTFKTIQ